MLHVGILPNHGAWGDFLANLALVVVDEAHVYRGVFGSHVANVLRRLRRLARRLRNRAALRAHFARRSPTRWSWPRGSPAWSSTLVDRDGAPRGEREIVMCNPPLLDERTGRRASSISEAAGLFADLVARGVRTICFAAAGAAPS